MQPPSHPSLRRIPKVDDLLAHAAGAALLACWPREQVVIAIRAELDAVRRMLRSAGTDVASLVAADRILAATGERLARDLAPRYRRAVNATGVILHTNLGRAPLARAARDAVAAAAGYCVLEIDAETGERSRRDAAVEAALKRLTGAEAATVVNNNAAACLLALSALATGREVVVSRGELVEIGGGFRVPEVMAAGGAVLHEVGTTNRTHLADYERAINEHTALILKVHRSNFHMVGFTQDAGLQELAALARRCGLPLAYDLGSGAMLDLSPWGVDRETPVKQCLDAGADLVLASGDKLLGGPQAGIACGRADLVDKLRKHPLARAMRMDKLGLAALEATLQLYLDPEAARREVPVLAMLAASREDLARRAQDLASRLQEAAREAGLEGKLTVQTQPGESRLGGGSAPEAPLPTTLLAVRANGCTEGALAEALRRSDPPVFARVQDGWLLADPRTLLPGDEDVLVQAVVSAAKRGDT